jgi:hypothetical protein
MPLTLTQLERHLFKAADILRSKMAELRDRECRAIVDLETRCRPRVVAPVTR